MYTSAASPRYPDQHAPDLFFLNSLPLFVTPLPWIGFFLLFLTYNLCAVVINDHTSFTGFLWPAFGGRDFSCLPSPVRNIRSQ